MIKELDYLRKTFVPTPNATYNKIIDISLKTKQGQIIDIKTPRRGRKPNISISGQLGMNGNASNFDLHITNFYSDSILSDTTEVDVYAGYNDKLSFALSGTVQNVYTDSPGPDKTTTLQCITAIYDAWFNKTISLELKEGFSVKQFISQISQALGFEEAIMDNNIADLACNNPLLHNGKISAAISKFKKCMPDLCITPIGRKLRVFSIDPKKTKAFTTYHILEYLSQAPQFSGGTVNLVLPWNPTIRCGDVVYFPTTFAKTSVGALKFNTAIVNLINFEFSTVDSTNSMSITATPTTSGV